ncbi:Predicted arabinose efflux permease, MFS family [Pseudoxanthomonas sp. GM95]|uniref:MFS transporter n=1 Tax=Pseudoxanthomonas sp. GM95 TaxID=1881043 RepID=UPI0008D7B704|nr:MFS transporter [Pseudoxanthomonas sp. GM95]SEL94157.1 Predicted arabinose efflux permease, MFS family [Pseudoxanthomonas sp. GM95]
MTPDTSKLDLQVMVPLFCIVSIDAIGMGVILPLLPFYAAHYGATALVIGLLTASFSLAQAVAAPWLGRLSDRIGRKKVLLASQAGTALSLVMLALSGGMVLVFIARILDGLTSGNMSVATAYAVDRSQAGTRKQAIGVISAAAGIGLIVGPSLSGMLASISLAAPVWLAALLSGASLITTMVLLPADQLVQDRKKPIPASPHRRLSILATSSPATLATLSILTAFFLAFSMYISQLALFVNARFEWAGAAMEAREVGYLFTVAGAINIFVQLFLMKRIGRAISDSGLAIACLASMAAGFVLLAVSPGLIGLFGSVAIVSFASSLARPTLTAALTFTAAPNQQGSLMGISTSAMAVSSIVGPIIAGALISAGYYVGWSLVIAAVFAMSAIAIGIFTAKHVWPLPDHPEN